MFTVDTYTPTRVIFGAGRLEELASVELPGTKALICVTADGLMEKIGVQQRVLDLLAKNNVEAAIFSDITPNPNRETVMAAAALAEREGCDFFIGLGGGSSIDVAKATAIIAKNGGDLWDYAEVGSGGRKPVQVAAPIITIATTCGTGTETDQYCVITKEETAEKIDFTMDALFPTLSIIDPELMVSPLSTSGCPKRWRMAPTWRRARIWPMAQTFWVDMRWRTVSSRPITSSARPWVGCSPRFRTAPP